MPEPLVTLLASFATRLIDLAEEMQGKASRLPTADMAGPVDGAREPEQVAQMLLDQLHARKQFLSPSLFHEPAWEILLTTFVAEGHGTVLNVKQLVSLIDAPATTSQRWIDQLVHMKLLQRKVDAVDRRRLEISISAAGSKAICDYLAWLVRSDRH